MTDKSTIPTHLLMLASAGFAAFLQLGLILTLGEPMDRRRLVGAFIVAAILGGCGTVIAQEFFKWPSFLSGVAGTLTGMIPAAVSASTITKAALKRAGLENQDVKDMLDTMRQASKQQTEQAPAYPPTPPAPPAPATGEEGEENVS